MAEYLHFTKYLTRPGEWVLDVTGGSFASGKAAKALGRNYVGVDIDRTAAAKGREWVEEA
jgi:DNA modification methylase